MDLMRGVNCDVRALKLESKWNYPQGGCSCGEIIMTPMGGRAQKKNEYKQITCINISPFEWYETIK